MIERTLPKIAIHPAARWAAVVVWMAVIFMLSAQPTLPDLMPGLPRAEEFAGHLAAYALLATLGWWALIGTGCRYPATWALVISMLYGMSDEFHQSFVPGRDASVEDLLLDLVGVGVALAVIGWLRGRQLRRQVTRAMRDLV